MPVANPTNSLPKEREWHRRLLALEPCREAYAWALRFPTYAAAWDACTKGAWIFFLLEVTGKAECDYSAAVCPCGRSARWLKAHYKRPALPKVAS